MSKQFEKRMKSLLTESEYQIFLIDLEIVKQEAQRELLWVFSKVNIEETTKEMSKIRKGGYDEPK